MRYEFITADVFTARRFGGNQLAVFPDAAGLEDATMQRIAREFNLSETVFAFPPENPHHTRRLRIFTPASEIPFAGHPTVGTAYVLATTGAIALSDDRTHIVFEENAGPVPVTIFAQDGIATGAQLTAPRAPEYAPAPEAAAIAAALGLDAGDLMAGEYGPQVASAGTPFLIVPLRDLGALARARVVSGAWDALDCAGCTGVFMLVFEGEPGAVRLRARMYAPAFGVPEDPATGSACAALGGYLGVRAQQDGTLRWTVEQGVEMGRPSLLEVEADVYGGVVERTRVGGRAVLVSEGWMETGH
jgi:trans-2,3-dihydro-3-hydroxyanthranilate isomerase